MSSTKRRRNLPALLVALGGLAAAGLAWYGISTWQTYPGLELVAALAAMATFVGLCWLAQNVLIPIVILVFVIVFHDDELEPKIQRIDRSRYGLAAIILMALGTVTAIVQVKTDNVGWTLFAGIGAFCLLVAVGNAVDAGLLRRLQSYGLDSQTAYQRGAGELERAARDDLDGTWRQRPEAPEAGSAVTLP